MVINYLPSSLTIASIAKYVEVTAASTPTTIISYKNIFKCKEMLLFSFRKNKHGNTNVKSVVVDDPTRFKKRPKCGIPWANA